MHPTSPSQLLAYVGRRGRETLWESVRGGSRDCMLRDAWFPKKRQCFPPHFFFFFLAAHLGCSLTLALMSVLFSFSSWVCKIHWPLVCNGKNIGWGAGWISQERPTTVTNRHHVLWLHHFQSTEGFWVDSEEHLVHQGPWFLLSNGPVVFLGLGERLILEAFSHTISFEPHSADESDEL